MNRKNIVVFVLAILSMNAFAQNKYIKGVVLNASDSLPLVYVNIYSNAYKFGTITNEVGKYILNYPDSLTTFKVSYSSLGFLTKDLLLSNIRDTIYLKPSDIMLDEVVLHNANTDIEFVLDKVHDNIKNNYFNKRHLLKAFYRQVAIDTKDSTYLRIVEADVGIQEYGILKALDRDRIKINQYRKSDDKRSDDWREKVAELMFDGVPNSLFWVKKKDFVKNFVKHKDFKYHYNNIIKNYHFDFENYTSIDDNLVALYSFYPKEQVGLITLDEHKSKLYINLNDFAIMRVKLIYVLGKSEPFSVFGPTEFNYAKIGDYYYLNKVLDYKKFSGKNNSKEFLLDHLYVYQVETDRKDYEKVKRKEAEKTVGDVYKKEIAIDTTFWNRYIMLPVVPLKAKLKALLQQDKNLEKQFLDNGKKQ